MEDGSVERFDDSNTPIKRTMKFGEVINKFPEAIDVFLRNGIHCVGCGFAFWESIEQGINGHGKSLGLNLEKILKELNDAVLSNQQH